MMIDTGPMFYSAIPTALARGLKVKVKNLEIFILKCFKGSYFQNHMIDFWFIFAMIIDTGQKFYSSSSPPIPMT